MPSTAKDRQISVRVAGETDAWLEARAGSGKNKAGFIRRLIERERSREREQELLAMFNEAAADVTNEDLDQFGMMEYITVYIPSSYAVAGTLFFVKQDRVKLLNDIQAADALKFAISGGVVEVDES